MKLEHLIQGIDNYKLKGDKNIDILGISYDSRRIKKGYVFVAIRGHMQDGHKFLGDAVKRGAIALVAENYNEIFGSVSRIRVADTREVLSKLAVQFYENPCKEMDIIGITGTNGKTSTTYILESIFSAAGKAPGVIGTINSHFKGKSFPASVTTPESLDLMGLMRKMSDSGATHVFLEVSSHALDQGRVKDCPFKAAVFTNFSRDHLDYHKTMEDYFRAKSRLFSALQNGNSTDRRFAIINIDDPKGKDLAALTGADIVTYGLGRDSQVRAVSVQTDRSGIGARLITPLGERDMRSSLVGDINIYNILAAAATATALGVALDYVVEGIARLRMVPGRLERVENRKGVEVFVDYAHTPDALLKALETLRSLAEGRLITVFGCGGDRDKGKRFEMGLASGENSDIVFLTSDNPRSEDPERIIDQIEEGTISSGMSKVEWPTVPGPMEKKYFRETDRRKAIQKAISMANGKDIVLIAGKGHEDYQIMGTEKRHFDDREEASKVS